MQTFLGCYGASYGGIATRIKFGFHQCMLGGRPQASRCTSGCCCFTWWCFGWSLQLYARLPLAGRPAKGDKQLRWLVYALQTCMSACRVSLPVLYHWLVVCWCFVKKASKCTHPCVLQSAGQIFLAGVPLSWLRGHNLVLPSDRFDARWQQPGVLYMLAAGTGPHLVLPGDT